MSQLLQMPRSLAQLTFAVPDYTGPVATVVARTAWLIDPRNGERAMEVSIRESAPCTPGRRRASWPGATRAPVARPSRMVPTRSDS